MTVGKQHSEAVLTSLALSSESCDAAAELAEMRNKIRSLQAEPAAAPLRLPPGPPLDAYEDPPESATVASDQEQFQMQPSPPLPARRKPRYFLSTAF